MQFVSNLYMKHLFNIFKLHLQNYMETNNYLVP